MRCPVCSGSLREVKMQLVTAEICSGCEGIWFDKHKLKWAANQLAVREKIDPNELRFLFKKRIVEKPDKDEPIRTCPKCTLAMKKVNYAYDSNIFIDRCRKCEGVWTDKGELIAIGRFIKEDPRVQEIGKSLAESTPSVEGVGEDGGIGYALMPTLSAVPYLGVIAPFAFAVLTMILDRMADFRNKANDYIE